MTSSTSIRDFFTSADDATDAIESSTTDAADVASQTSQNLLALLTEQFPQYSFRLHKSGKYVERARNDGNYRRACKHGRFSNECSPCVAEYATDKSIVRRKVKAKTKVPQHFDPLQNRPEHEVAPVIPFSGDHVAASEKMQGYIANAKIVPNDNFEKPCLILDVATFAHGQSAVSHKGKTMFAHCYFWMVHHKREIPDGFVIRHLCVGSRSCCEPTHLEIGTQRQNMFEDKLRDGTLQHGEKHHSTKLTNQTALAIFQSKGSGTRAERAVKFGVSPYVVKKIDSGETWSHVTGKHTARNKERERVYQKNQSRSRSDATREDYEKAVARIEARNVPANNGKGCMVTTFAKTKEGYGITSMLGHQTRCHIIMWEFHHNNCQPKPRDMVIKHSCDTPACNLPDHLKLGTHSENQKERWRRTGKKRKTDED